MDSVPGKGIFEPKTPAKIESISNKPKKKYTEEFKDSNIHGSKHDKRSQEDFDNKDKSGIKLRDDPVFTAAVTPPGCSRKSPRVFRKLRASSNIWNFSRPLVEFNDKKWDTSMPQTPEITHTKQRIQGRESELCKDGVLKGVGMMEKVNFINKLNCKDNGLKVYYRKKKGLKQKELKFFRDRVNSFLQNMHLIQGNRRFSQWRGSALDSIVGAYLTQNVTDTLSSSAFMSLAANYQHAAAQEIVQTDGRYSYGTSDSVDWEAVRIANVNHISKAIEARGMNKKLAARIKNCLDFIRKEHGSIDMEWLRGVSHQRAKDYLMKIPGLGLKSVECICLLTLRQAAFPIDTNAARIAVRAVRLGWVPLQPLPLGHKLHHLTKYPKENTIQLYLWQNLSEFDWSTLYELHCQMIAFGKVFCTKKNPNCNECPMRTECQHFASSSSSAQQALPNSEPMEMDIEDFGLNKVPKIKFDLEKFKENVDNIIDGKNIFSLPESDTSKDLMILTSNTASNAGPKMKNTSHLRTVHEIYVLPDSHHLLAAAGLEKRETDDSSPYLLAIWTSENHKAKSPSLDATNKVAVWGTLLLPIRTALRGSFPLNGTYFQINEVFADDESSEIPIIVPTRSLLGLPRATLYCGKSISAICKGMKTFEVQKCFWSGFICLRGFNRKTRQPTPLASKFHLPTSRLGRRKNK